METILEFLLMYRRAKKAFKAKAVLEIGLDEIVRNAMGYAWEIGKGQPMQEVLTTSVENPFLNPDWRQGVMRTGVVGIDG